MFYFNVTVDIFQWDLMFENHSSLFLHYFIDTHT